MPHRRSPPRCCVFFSCIKIPASRFLQRCFAAFETPSHVFFVTEYLEGGDLFFHLTRRVDATAVGNINAGFSEREARGLLSEVVLGLIHMHKNNFIHCDIKVGRSAGEE